MGAPTGATGTDSVQPAEPVAQAPSTYSECGVYGEDGAVAVSFVGFGARSVCNEWVREQPTSTLWLKGELNFGARGIGRVCDLVYRDQLAAQVYVAQDDILGGVDAESACQLLLQTKGWRQAPPGGFNPLGE